jgi:hypothetical protein
MQIDRKIAEKQEKKSDWLEILKVKEYKFDELSLNVVIYNNCQVGYGLDRGPEQSGRHADHSVSMILFPEASSCAS